MIFPLLCKFCPFLHYLRDIDILLSHDCNHPQGLYASDLESSLESSWAWMLKLRDEIYSLALQASSSGDMRCSSVVLNSLTCFFCGLSRELMVEVCLHSSSWKQLFYYTHLILMAPLSHHLMKAVKVLLHCTFAEVLFLERSIDFTN